MLKQWLMAIAVLMMAAACGGGSPGTPAQESPVVPVPSPPVEAVDNDGDGVADATDACPNTPGNTAVDAFGCHPELCHLQASTALGACFSTVAERVGDCYTSTGAECAPNDATISNALDTLGSSVRTFCTSDQLVQQAGYGATVTVDAVVEQLQQACTGEPAALVARTWGGPLARLLTGGNAQTSSCLQASYSQAAELMEQSYTEHNACINNPQCDGSALAAADQAREQAFANAVTPICLAGGGHEQINGTTETLFASRTALQARCLVAAGHGDTSNVSLDCGPANQLLNNITVRLDDQAGAVQADVANLPRGVPLHVTMDTTAWGTRCGDGSEYAFMMRLSADADLLDHAILHQQGGGVCLVAAGDCTQRPQHLFEAVDSNGGDLASRGYLADRPDNPFKNWTAVFQPYCNQDLHIGGGGEETPGGRPENGGTLYRYGAINIRESSRLIRDLLWRIAKDSTATGYLATDPRIIVGGTSAGGYGVQYNLHYFLDDLRWTNTIGAPHVAFLVGGGSTDLSLLFTSAAVPWLTRAYRPPYCLEDNCSLSVNNHPRHAERMGRTPFQKLVNLSPQHDDTQEPTQGFPGPAPLPPPAPQANDWINGLRADYCQMRGTPNLFFHLGANTIPRHDFISTDAIFDDQIKFTRELLVNGASELQMLADMANYPGQTIDRVEEGPTIDGVDPFPCDVSVPVNGMGDFDGDQIINQLDVCQGTAAGVMVAANGCEVLVNDADADGVTDGDVDTDGGFTPFADQCAGTPVNEAADEFGCGPSQRDTDGDGVFDDADQCLGTDENAAVDGTGCPLVP